MLNIWATFFCLRRLFYFDMARPSGSRNADYEQIRRRIAFSLAAHLRRADGEVATFKDLAAAAGVGPTTLKHYFRTREDAVRSALEAVLEISRPYLEMLAVPGDKQLAASLRHFLASFVAAWRLRGFGRLVSLGLASGLEHDRLGPVFVTTLLEPTVQVAERLLNTHVERGDLTLHSTRHAALSLVAPILLGLLHQDNLHGVRCRPLDMSELLEDQLQLFLNGVGPPIVRK